MCGCVGVCKCGYVGEGVWVRVCGYVGVGVGVGVGVDVAVCAWVFVCGFLIRL